MLTSGLNPNLVKTALDAVFMPEFKRAAGPQIAQVTDESVFRQATANNSAVITEIMKDGGLWSERPELGALAQATPLSGQQKTFTVSNSAQALGISKQFMDDENWDAVNEMVRDYANKGRLTDTIGGFGIYRGAFATTTTNDGAFLCSNTHTNLNGDTIDNLLTSALDPDSLNDAIVMLAEQKDQAGDIVGTEAATLLVPSNLFKHACEITESELLADTAENNKNVYSTKYGIKVLQSPHIGAAAGGSDTAWFLLARNHKVYRWARKEIETYYTPFDYSDNFVSYYKGEFRNVYGAISYTGLVGSTGAA